MEQILEVFAALSIALSTFVAPAVEEPEEEYVEEYYEYEYDYSDYYYENYEEYIPSDGLNAYTGINEHDGRVESYYSSNVLYHYRTNEWTVDEEGFYRDADGYYVVAASDMEEGETFEGSKGQCKVYDCGCSEGVTDYYVNW